MRLHVYGAPRFATGQRALSQIPIRRHLSHSAAATTNVEYTLRVIDTVSGLTKEYFNELGTAARLG